MGFCFQNPRAADDRPYIEDCTIVPLMHLVGYSHWVGAVITAPYEGGIGSGPPYIGIDGRKKGTDKSVPFLFRPFSS